MIRVSCPMPFQGGDVFLGLGRMVDGQYVALDGRCAVLHLTIDHTAWFDGLTDVRAEYSVVYRGTIDRVRTSGS